MGLGIGIFELLGCLALLWIVVTFFSFGETGCANFLVGIALFYAILISIQNFFIWISPYLIWMALVPLIPIGLWLGKVLERRLATGRVREPIEANPEPKSKDL